MIATSCLLAYFTCYFKELQDFPENFARDFCDPEQVKIYCTLQPKNCCLSKRSSNTPRGRRGFYFVSLLGSNQRRGLFAGRCRRLGTRLPASRGTRPPDFPTSGFFLPSTQRLA